MRTSSRRGFTLVELLIVIAIIGLLMGLLLPAVQAARERSRMAQCNANQKELALAMKDAALTPRGGFPGWTEEEKMADGRIIAVPWTFKLLPRIEETTLREQILTNNFTNFVPPPISLFNCPSDASTNPDVGVLTYIVNSGMQDNFRAITYPNSDLEANGVCHDQRSGRKGPTVKSGASDIKDGETKTLLISENVHKDIQALNNTSCSWLGPLQERPISQNKIEAAQNATMTLNPEQRFGMVWVYDSQNPFTPSPGLFQPINRDDDARSRPYGDLNFGARFARPASTHPEVFIAAFCDGHTREIRENIDYRVYQQLMTPNGAKAALAAAPQELIEALVREDNNGEGFMTKPLSENDY